MRYRASSPSGAGEPDARVQSCGTSKAPLLQLFRWRRECVRNEDVRPCVRGGLGGATGPADFELVLGAGLAVGALALAAGYVVVRRRRHR